MRLLLIEDETALRESLAARLTAEGYRVDTAVDGEDGLFQACEYPFDLLIVDLGLPKLNGIQLIERVRAAGHTMPILILTARANWQEKVAGLEAGADDYLTKPFEYPELAARVMALLRRALKALPNGLDFGVLQIDFARQQVRNSAGLIELTAFEYRLLEHLIHQRPNVVSKLALADYLYPHEADRDSNVIEVLLSRLRRKLDQDSAQPSIETVRGRGYRFALETV
ncbi:MULTISPECIES: response regulator transcription factor [Deefgea]|uniref:Response regulator n=1 Tax=Deefgea chitinilytica TaxID=570276 RepID=A0ABS2CFJ8_9NEIS|nr:MULTISPECIES: response regulator transcription factor [Deefgea]MBM5572847.1 response regulator [Deefgea chitinilytica]MBM9890084.1 response regulator transcription factor [Deefgea sp. CFH1-16]